jgi:hypothetical protein
VTIRGRSVRPAPYNLRKGYVGFVTRRDASRDQQSFLANSPRAGDRRQGCFPAITPDHMTIFKSDGKNLAFCIRSTENSVPRGGFGLGNSEKGAFEKRSNDAINYPDVFDVSPKAQKPVQRYHVYKIDIIIGSFSNVVAHPFRPTSPPGFLIKGSASKRVCHPLIKFILRGA